MATETDTWRYFRQSMDGEIYRRPEPQTGAWQLLDGDAWRVLEVSLSQQDFEHLVEIDGADLPA